MDKEFELAQSVEMERRSDFARTFFEAVMDPEDRPYFVSDEATLWAVVAGNEEDVIRRCEAHFGVKLSKSDFDIPIWRLLDAIKSRRQHGAG